MKNLLLVAIVLFATTFAIGQNDGKIYDEKSGKVVYHYEIGGEKIDFTLIFDDYGKRQVMDITNNEGGVKTRVKTVITPTQMFMVNYEDKQVIILPVTGDDNSMSVSPAGDMGIDVDAIVKNAQSSGVNPTGTETLLGKECKVFEQKDGTFKGKYWIHNNYLIKAEFISEGVHTYMEAKEFKVGISISASEFEVPKGYTVTDMAKQMQQMQQMYGVPDNE